MIRIEPAPGHADRLAWTAAALCVAGLLVTMAINGMVELGEVAHDAFCADHGWAVERT